MCEPPSHPSRSAPRAGGSLRSTTGPDKRAAREGRARASATSGSPVGTRTYLSNVNVPFSQPSGDRVQKVGRKVRSRDEGTLTLGPAARSARPAPRLIPKRPQAPADGGCATRLLEPDEMEKAVVCSSAPENRNRTQVRAVILQGSGEWKRRACRR